jgi:hypothetical protein
VKTLLAIIGALFVVFVLTMMAVCNDSDDQGWARTYNKQALSLEVPAPPASFVASHEQPRCYDDGYCEDDGYGRGGDGGESGGHQGYGGGGGRSGDYDGGDGDGDRCRNICNNTFPIVPSPGGEGGQRV